MSQADLTIQAPGTPDAPAQPGGLPRPTVRLLGVEGDFGTPLGLTKDWAYQIIKQVGNYGEVFEKNVGSGSRINIARGQNNLWTKGGLQYAPPIR